MNQSFNYFSLDKTFWIQIKEHQVNFGCNKLPLDVHFTIGFDPRTKYIDLHITRNVADQKNKPKLTLIKFYREEILADLERMMLVVVRNHLQLLDIKTLEKEHEEDICFISWDDLKASDSYSKLKDNLLNELNAASRIKRKSRVKMQSDVMNRIEKFANSKEIQAALLACIREVPEDLSKNIDGGMIVTKNSVIQVVRLFGQWFKINTTLTPSGLLNGIVSPEIVKTLIYRTKRAIVHIKRANSYEDVKDLDKKVMVLIKKKKLS